MSNYMSCITSRLTVFFILMLPVEAVFPADIETNSASLQPYKKNYIIYGPNEGRNENGDFKLQISFLTLFKAAEFEDKLGFIDLNSPKLVNLGFNYTQTFFNAFAENSSPMESTDYMPGLFISFQSRKPALGGFRQALIGWEHESNGEVDGGLNRSWDQGFIEVLLGFGRKFDDTPKMNERALAEPNLKARQNLPIARIGSNEWNLRARVSWPLSISDDNPDIREFYGVYEMEGSYRNTNHEFGLTVLGGHEETSYVVEISSNRVPLLSEANEFLDDKYNCQSSIRKGLKQRFMCIFRYTFAPFDLVDNHGAWMVQYFDGYGESIRDYDIQAHNRFRLGYRFSMPSEFDQ